MSKNRRQVASLEKLRLDAMQRTLAIAAGLAPPLRWKTGRVEDEDDVWAREEEGRRTVLYHRNVHNVWSTMGIFLDEPDANERGMAEVQRRRDADRAALIARFDLRLVPLRDVADYYLDLMDPEPAGAGAGSGDPSSAATASERERVMRLARENHRRRVVALDRIVPFFGKSATMADVSLAKLRGYIDARSRNRARPGARSDGRVKPQTAAADARWLAAAFNAFAKEHGWERRISVTDLPRAERREFHLDRKTYVRLLVTLRRGWIWDEERGEWLTELVVDPETGQTSRRKLVDPAFARGGHAARFRGRMAQRAVLLGINGGMRPGGLCGMGWAPHPSRGWIDVDNGRINQGGTIGKPKRRPSGKVIVQNKRSAPVPLPRQMRVHTAIWRKADARIAASHVVQKLGARGWGYADGGLLRLIQEGGLRIGIPKGQLCLHTMRHSCITMMLENNVPVQMVADFVDDDVRTVKHWYSHLGLDKPWLRDGKPVPIRNPLEALELRDRGPMLAKRERLAREAAEKAHAEALDRAMQAEVRKARAKKAASRRRARKLKTST